MKWLDVCHFNAWAKIEEDGCERARNDNACTELSKLPQPKSEK